MGLETQAEIDEWHVFCASQTHPAIKNWYAHKLANPWVLPTINKFLSKMSPDDWDITPIHSNYVETAHAGRNAETSIGAALLTAILEAKGRDNVKVKEMAQTERDGVMRHRWNGSAEREKLSAQRQVSKLRKTAIRNDQLNSYETLKAEREAGTNEHKASSERQRALESQIKSLQEEMKLDKHRTDLKEQVNDLRRDIEEEKALRRDWLLRRNQIETNLNQLKAGPLAGFRIGGRRPAARPSGQADSGVATGHASIPPIASDLGKVDADPVNSIDGTEGAATAMVTEPDPRGVGPDAPVLPDDHELNSMESDDGLTADPNSNFSNELSRFEKTLFENPPPFVDYFDMEELLPNFDPLAFNFDTIHADPPMSFQVLPTPEPTSSNLLVLPMPQPSPPFVAATIEEEIPALPTRKRSRQAEVDERNIVEGSRHRVKSRRTQGQL
ncbi:hypothetical protein B0H11DRAFT_2273963 [Mycena galericulata]|nr:hypothetical protein B0H11DRAFT_2273963 [Mycena galericulata]